MKTLCMALILLFGLSASGQHGHHGLKLGKEEQLTPEQRAELHAKKLTLALDLSSAQQQKVQSVFLIKEETRTARKEALNRADSSSHDPQRHYQLINQRLDAMIAHKKEMKAILTAEQYAEWEEISFKEGHRRRHLKDRKGHRPHRKG